jgi:hypothetical protein
MGCVGVKANGEKTSMSVGEVLRESLIGEAAAGKRKSDPFPRR